MAMTVAQKYVGKIAGFLGFFQGIAWFGLSAFCLKQYSEQLNINFDSYMDVWNYLVASQLFFGELDNDVDYVLTPRVFKIFAGIYLVLSGLWAIASLNVLQAITRNSVKIPSSLKYWGFLTWLICILDFILSCILFVDFKRCSVGVSGILIGNVVLEGICTTIYIPVLTIVARGFVLLVVNFVFAIVTERIGKNLAMKATKSASDVVRLRLAMASTTSPTSQPAGPPAQNQEPFRNNYYPASDGINYNNNNVPTIPNPYPFRYPYPRNPLPQNWTEQNTGGGYNEMNPVTNRNYPSTSQQY